MRILEQGISNLEDGGEGSVEAIGMFNLAISTLLYERGRFRDSMEKLEAVHHHAPCLAFRGIYFNCFLGRLYVCANGDGSGAVFSNELTYVARHGPQICELHGTGERGDARLEESHYGSKNCISGDSKVPIAASIELVMLIDTFF